VPPIETIINTKMSAVSDFIEQTKKPNEKLASVYKAISELINSFSEDEIRQGFTVALADKFFKDIIHEKLDRVRTGMVAVPQEICMEIGQEDGVNEDDIRSYLYTTCKLMPQEIHKARVLKNKTFISVPENRLQECFATMRSKPLENHSYRIYLMEDTYRTSNERTPRRSDRRGPRRDSRTRRPERRTSDRTRKRR